MSHRAPLSHNQSRYLASLLADPACSEGAEHVEVVRVDGHRPEAVSAALVVLYSHHDALRSRLVAEAGGFVMAYEDPGAPLPLLSPQEVRPFDPEAIRRSVNLIFGEPLFRVGIEDDPQSTRLILAVHHLIYDGWSWNLFREQLGDVLRNDGSATGSSTGSVGSSYGHFARVQVAGWSSASLIEKDHWEGILDTLEAEDLGRDHPLLSASPHYRLGMYPVALPSRADRSLSDLCRRMRVSRFSVLRSATMAGYLDLVGGDLLAGTDDAFRIRGVNDALFGFVVTTQYAYLFAHEARLPLHQLVGLVASRFEDAGRVASGCTEQTMAELEAPMPLKISQSLTSADTALGASWVPDHEKRHWRPLTVAWVPGAREGSITYRTDMFSIDFARSLSDAIVRRVLDD